MPPAIVSMELVIVDPLSACATGDTSGMGLSVGAASAVFAVAISVGAGGG
jgi:hypothetical protein